LEAEAEMFPMRRELKAAKLRLSHAAPFEAEMFPMRRELKEVVDDALVTIQLEAEMFPMRRELKGKQGRSRLLVIR